MQSVARAVWLVFALSALACESFEPRDNAGLFESCCRGAGTCVPASLVPADAAEQLGPGGCDRDLLCAPNELTRPEAVPESCRAVGGGEGRCLLTCLPEVAKRAEQLERGRCDADSLCVPCHDPLSGDDTGACRLGPDEPRESARVFAPCCEQLGRCVPRELLLQSQPAEDVERLGPDSCEDEQQACVPMAWIEGEPAPGCRALGDLEGRCLPRCLPELEPLAARLTPGDCDERELCVPCFDPLSGDDTGACRLSEDAPREPAQRFDDCCEQRGRCVPREALSAQDPAQLARLGPDHCDRDGDALCVPEAWLGEELRFEPCRGPAGVEGRCLSSCLPEVAQQADRLARDACADGDLCVPCYDPLSGQATGACSAGEDAPREPPATLAGCCGERGRCVPRELLEASQPAGDLARLGPDACPEVAGSEALCVPAEWLEAGPVVQNCRALGQFEGRCVSSCLPEIAAQAAQLGRDDCSEGALCVPCFDPRSGVDTQACRLGQDAPREPARTFEPCCGQGDAALGACVPVSLLSSEQAAALPAESCSDPETRCAPSSLLRDPEAPLPSCSRTGLLSSEPQPGVCIPSCFLTLTALLVTSQETCAMSEVCAPCSAVADTLPGCP